MNPSPAQASGLFEAATYRKITIRIMPFLFLCYVLAYVNRVNVSFAKLQMQHDLGMSDAGYGIGAGMFFIGYFFSNVPSNMLLKRIGARGLLGPILILRGILSTAMIFMHGTTGYYVLRFFGGVVEGGFFPGVILYLTFWYTARYRGEMMALFMSAIPISGIFSGPLSGFMLTSMQGVAGLNGWQWLFLTCGIPCSLVGFGVLFLMTNDPERADWLSAQEKKLVLGNLEAEREANQRAGGAKSKLSDAFRSGDVWLLCLVYFGMMCANYGIGFYMPQIIRDTISQDPRTIGWLYAITWTVTTIVMFWVGRHSDKTGERRWHVALSLLIGGLAFAVSGIHGLPGAVGLIALTVATSGVLSSMALFYTFPAALLAGTAAAAGIAWINAVGNLGGYAAPHAAGVIVDHTHSTALAMVAMAGAMMVSGLVTIYVTRKGALRR